MTEATLTSIPDTIPYGGNSAMPWRFLRLLNLFRAIVAGLIIVLFGSGDIPTMLGYTKPSLFLWIGSVYFAFSILASFAIRQQQPPVALQTYLYIVTDIAAVTLLVHASGGTVNGLGSLLFVPIAVCSMLMSQRMAIASAAMATLALLGEQTFDVLQGRIAGPGYTLTGMLGLIFFITAFVAWHLSHRLSESEALAEQRGLDLQNLSQLNEYIIDHMRTGIVVTDNSGLIRLMNGAAMDQLGIGRNPRGHHLEEVMPELSMALSRWQESRHISHPALTGKVRLIPHFADLGGQDGGSLVFLEDAGRVAEQVRQMKLAALGRLTASIAHEIRNPLGAVSHANQLLAESERLGNEEHHLTQIINEQSGRVNRIVETILQLTKRENARPEQLDLCSWLPDFRTELCERQALQLSMIGMHQRGIDDKLMVRMDPGHLHQVLWNLAENALRYGAPEQSQKYISLQTKVDFALGMDTVSKCAYLEVLDHGKGVPDDLVEHIFEPFYTSSSRGTGLGLYIARELCEYNQATLVYEHRHGGGACFRIVFGDPHSWVT